MKSYEAICKLKILLEEIASDSIRTNEPQEAFVKVLLAMKEHIDLRVKDCSGDDNDASDIELR